MNNNKRYIGNSKQLSNGERPANRLIGGGKEGDLSAPKGAHLLNQPEGNRSREGGYPQGWKAQTTVRPLPCILGG